MKCKIDVKKYVNEDLYIAVLILQLIIFYSFCYGDIFIILAHGLKFWDCLFLGDIQNFYSHALDTSLYAGLYTGIYSALYDFMIYIIFAIWELPLWIAQEVFGIENILNTLFGAMWGKSIMLPFIAILIIAMKKIWQLVGIEDDVQWKASFLFLTSILFTTYVCLVGQYDIIPISVMMLGILFYLQEKWCLFVVLFSLAIPIKAFALLPFLILLLYKEKNILKIITNVICALCPIIIMRTLIPFSAQPLTSSYLTAFFENKLPISYNGIYLFFVIIVALCFWVYIQTPADNMRQFCHEVAYFLFLSFATLLCLGFTFPYWLLYITPFMYWIIVNNWEISAVNLAAELGISFFSVVSHAMTYTWVFSSPLAGSSMLLSRVLREMENQLPTLPLLIHHLMGDKMNDTYLELVTPICMSISMAFLLIFLFINNPKKERPTICSIDIITTYAIYVFRLIFAYAICLIPLGGYFLH